MIALRPPPSRPTRTAASPARTSPNSTQANKSKKKRTRSKRKKTYNMPNQALISEPAYWKNEPLSVEEDHHHEFKIAQGSFGVIGRTCSKYISAFLNSDGGELYLGVDDEGRAIGIELDRRSYDKLMLIIDHRVSLMRPQVDARKLKVNKYPVYDKDLQSSSTNRYIIVICIEKSTQIHRDCHGIPWIRRFASVHRMTERLIGERLQKSKSDTRSFYRTQDAQHKQVVARAKSTKQQETKKDEDNPRSPLQTAIPFKCCLIPFPKSVEEYQQRQLARPFRIQSSEKIL